jgi:hypothetical protein
MTSSKVLITVSLLAMLSYGSLSPSALLTQANRLSLIGQSSPEDNASQAGAPAAADEQPNGLQTRGQTENSHTIEAKPELDDRELGVGQTDVA